MRTLLATAFAILMLVPGSGTKAQTADLSGVKPGDRWTYDYRDEISGDVKHTATYVTVDVTDKEITTRLSLRGRPGARTVAYTPSWSRIDDDTWKFEPHEGAQFTAPFKVGTEWRFANSAKQMRTGTTLSTTGVGKIVAQETLTTPAGTFDVFRVEVTERQANATDPTKTADVKLVFWYAPTVNRWVKRTVELRVEGRVRERTSDTLVEYSRKP
jgi:hypothetical protein